MYSEQTSYTRQWPYDDKTSGQALQQKIQKENSRSVFLSPNDMFLFAKSKRSTQLLYFCLSPGYYSQFTVVNKLLCIELRQCFLCPLTFPPAGSQQSSTATIVVAIRPLACLSTWWYKCLSSTVIVHLLFERRQTLKQRMHTHKINYSKWRQLTHRTIYIYIYIVIHRQTVSFYQNSSVWLDTQDARSRDRNPSNFTLD